MSKIIVIEGALDSIGKSTQFELLKKFLEEKHNVISHHFPTYDEIQGDLVMNYLQGMFGSPSDLSPYFINSLYAIDRKITWDNKLSKADDIILLDRYTTSSLIYQSALIKDEDEKKKFIDFVIDYEYEKLGIGKPDKVIFLTAPFDFIIDLKNKRDIEQGEQIQGDIHEKDLEFLKNVYESANYCAKYLNWDVVECANSKEFKQIEEIHKDIVDRLGD